MVSLDTLGAAAYIRSALVEMANPEKAAGMQSYMKTDMPFYGVQKPGRVGVMRHLVKEYAPGSHDEYVALVSVLWELPHREEKYLAQGVATAFPEFMTPASLSLYERFIAEGAWWDFVDETAVHMIRHLVLAYPVEVWPTVDTYIDHDDMWFRRTAIICQVGAKETTDQARLFRYCAARMHETEFFIRKGIGWALREYAKTDPQAVASFVLEHRDALSGLSFREATKHIGDLVG